MRAAVNKSVLLRMHCFPAMMVVKKILKNRGMKRKVPFVLERRWWAHFCSIVPLWTWLLAWARSGLLQWRSAARRQLMRGEGATRLTQFDACTKGLSCGVAQCCCGVGEGCNKRLLRSGHSVEQWKAGQDAFVGECCREPLGLHTHSLM